MAKTLQSTLIMSLIDRVTGPARVISASLAKLNSAALRNTAALDAMRGRMLDAVGMGYALARSLSAPINAAIDFESTMADIAKVVDFPTPKAFQQMGKDIREMSLRLPIAADGLGQIVAAAGQSGIANADLLRFTELAAKVGTAWDISAGEAGESIAKLKTALGRSIEDTASLADAINYLGNKSAASAPQILDVVKRVAPMASQFGMTAEQVAALGAAMTGSGFESEVAATSILNIGRALTRGASATGRQSAAFKRLGLSSKQVAKSMQKDAVGTLQDVLSRVGKLPDDMRASLVSDLFGDEARALGPLISNGKLLSDTLGLIADKSKYAGSAQAEFEARSKTTANNLQLFKNRVSDLAISVGDALVPAMNTVLGQLGPMVTNISDLAQRYPQLTSAITATTAALIAFRIAFTALRFIGLYAIGSVLTSIVGFTGLASALTAVGTALAVVSAPVWLGIAAAVALVGAAGAALYHYWDRIMAVLSGVGEALTARLAPALVYVQPAIDALAPALQAIGDAAGWVRDSLSDLGTLFSSVFDREILGYNHAQAISANARNVTNRIIDAFIEGHAAIFQAGADMIARLWEGMKSKFWEMVEWIKTIPQQIVSAVGSIDLPNAIKFKMPSLFGGGDKVDGERAGGGPVRGGGTYLVGERGPELFSPGRSGAISPNNAYQAAAQGAASGRSSGGSASVVYSQPVFNIYGATDVQAIAAEVHRQQGRAVKAAVESSFAGGAL